MFNVFLPILAENGKFSDIANNIANLLVKIAVNCSNSHLKHSELEFSVSIEGPQILSNQKQENRAVFLLIG